MPAVYATPPRHRMAPSTRERLPSSASSHRARLATVIAGRSNRRVRRSNAIGRISALNPRMKRMLTRLVPTMLPTARPGLPCRTASTPTASSGRLVPSATTVRPTTMGLTPRCEASAAPPRTSRSAPRSSPASPATISRALDMAPDAMAGPSGDDLGATDDGGLCAAVDRGPVELLAAAVDGVRRAVTGVDAVVAETAREQLLGDAARDLIVAVETGQLRGAMAAHQDVRELRAQDVLDVAEDAIVITRAAVAGLEVHAHLDTGRGEPVARRVQ